LQQNQVATAERGAGLLKEDATSKWNAGTYEASCTTVVAFDAVRSRFPVPGGTLECHFDVLLGIAI
jgi:hypothetical protein